MSSAPLQTGGGGTIKTSPGAFTIKSKAASKGTDYINILIYGAHGSGKTTLAGSAVDIAQMKDVLVITAEGGAMVFEENNRVTGADDLDILEVDRIEQFQKAYEYLRAHCSLRDVGTEEADAQLMQYQEAVGLSSDRLRRYRTVIVDSLSEIEALCLAKILGLDSIGLDAGDDMEVAGFPQFRKNNHIMQRAVRQLRDLPINTVITCAQNYTQDERKAYHYTPKLTGQLSTIVQGFFDVVGWLVVGQRPDENTAAPRRLYVQPQTAPKADAKCRLARYHSDFFDNPLMSDIMKGGGFIKE